MYRMLHKTLIARVLLMVATLLVASWASAQGSRSGLYVPSVKPVKDMRRALTNPEVFHLLIAYGGQESEYDIDALDLLDSAYRIAFDVENPMYYTMTIEGYGSDDEGLTRERVDAVYRYFAMRGGEAFPIRYARNPIHCSCNGDTTETLRFEVPVTMAVYNSGELPEARRVLNKTVDLSNTVLVTFRNNPDECVGAARGCFVPADDSVVHGYYSSLLFSRGSVYAVQGTKDTCPSNLTVSIEDHLDYKTIVEQYRLVPHRKQLIVQAGYVVLSTNWRERTDSCRIAQRDSIFVRIPVSKEQLDAKLKFFAKVKTSRGLEYKQLPTRKSPGKGELMIQAPINIGQFDTVYVGKRVQEKELGKYFYKVDGPTEAAAFRVGGTYYVAYRPAKGGGYELKKALRNLFRIIPEQEEIPSDSQQGKLRDPEEIIGD